MNLCKGRGVSLPADLAAAAEAKAVAEHRSFSSYVRKLIAQDLAVASAPVNFSRRRKAAKKGRALA